MNKIIVEQLESELGGQKINVPSRIKEEMKRRQQLIDARKTIPAPPPLECRATRRIYYGR